ncbi:MAG: hypothetical protein Fur0039_01540 [Rhodocyclaceae bacterium]
MSKTQIRMAEHEFPGAAQRGAAGALGGIRVLVVDDDPMSRGIARKLLSAAGASVEIAENGARALEVLEAGEAAAFDAVLMDIEMPTMDGLEASRRLRSRQRFSGLPIIALTAHAVVVECHCCIEAGMDDHIIKPFTSARLVEVIAHWTARGRRSAAGLRPAAGILDTEAAVARLGGNREFYSRIATQFAERYGGLDIEAIAARRGRAAAQLSVHSLNGFAGMIGAERLQDLATRLEEALGSNDPQTAALMPSFSAELTAVLGRVRDQLGGASPPAARGSAAR